MFAIDCRECNVLTNQILFLHFSCETSFMIMRCIAEKLKKDAFTAPFYPELEQDVGI